MAAGLGLTHFAYAEEQETTSDSVRLLSDPFLQLPTADSVRVVWFTEITGGEHIVLIGDGIESLTAPQVATGDYGSARILTAQTITLSRTAEDSGSRLPEDRLPAEEDGIVARPIQRHEAHVTELSTERTPYRVASVVNGEAAVSAVYTLAPSLPAGSGAYLMLTSDHQAMQNTPTNIELAAATMREHAGGELDAVVLAGDLVNHPDRASEWFDESRGSAFFPVLQGHGAREDRGGHIGVGAAVIQNTPLFPAIGNHEVQGRRDGMSNLGESFGNPTPREVAAKEYDRLGISEDRETWIENNSFSSRTYEEIFTLPENPQGHSRWYATTIGNVRLITLYHTRIWRGTEADPEPGDREVGSRYQEAADALDRPLERGYGEFLFESIAPGSDQFEWLQAELESPERKACAYTVVQMHEGPHGLGDNLSPHFVDPEEVQELDEAGNLVGIRYEYDNARNNFLHHVCPMLEKAGVQLVLNGHSHLWNRFVATNGITHYLEGSNTGNTYGAYTTRNQQARHVPPAPWIVENYPEFDNPGGLEPQVPNIEPYTFDEGDPMPYVSDNLVMAFQLFDSHTGELSTWSAPVAEPTATPKLIDRVTLQANDVVPLPAAPGSPSPQPSQTPTLSPTPDPSPSASQVPTAAPTPSASSSGPAKRPGLPKTGR